MRVDMRARWLAFVAVLTLGAMAFHGVAHAAVTDTDSCPACAVGAARTAAPAAPVVVQVETPVVVLEVPDAPSERPALAPRPTAQSPPRA